MTFEVRFEKGQRKDDVAKEHLAMFEGDEGVLFVGKAQEKASVFRTEKRRETVIVVRCSSSSARTSPTRRSSA